MGPCIPDMVSLCQLTCGAAPSQGPAVSRPGKKAPLCSPFPRVVGEGLWRKNKQTLTHPSLAGAEGGWGIPYPSVLPRASQRLKFIFWRAAQWGPPALLARRLTSSAKHLCLSVLTHTCLARDSQDSSWPYPACRCLCATTCTRVCETPTGWNKNCGWMQSLLWTPVADGSVLLSRTRRPALSLARKKETLISFALVKALFT